MNPRHARQARALARLVDEAGVTLSAHCKDRATELGYSLDDLLRCAIQPEQTYSCHPRYGPGRRMYQRGPVSLVVHEQTRTAITVLLRTTRTWSHGVDTRQTVVG